MSSSSSSVTLPHTRHSLNLHRARCSVAARMGVVDLRKAAAERARDHSDAVFMDPESTREENEEAIRARKRARTKLEEAEDSLSKCAARMAELGGQPEQRQGAEQEQEEEDQQQQQEQEEK